MRLPSFKSGLKGNRTALHCTAVLLALLLCSFVFHTRTVVLSEVSVIWLVEERVGFRLCGQ